MGGRRSSTSDQSEALFLHFLFLEPKGVSLLPRPSVSLIVVGFLPFFFLSLFWKFSAIVTPFLTYIRGGAIKSLARLGRKQATASKLGIYSKYSARNSIHFLVRCSNIRKPLKRKSESCPSNQVSAAAMISPSDEKWRPFNCFFSPGNRR